MSQTYDTMQCITLLREKREALQVAGETRYPRRADFTEAEIVAIKAHLGPWPRALEIAGIKPARDANGEHAEKIRQKRIRQKLLRRQERQNKD